MRPFEAEEYANGWAARIADQPRSANPYQRPYRGAWDSYRARAWDSGWRHCDHGAKWIDPRPSAKMGGE